MATAIGNITNAAWDSTDNWTGGGGAGGIPAVGDTWKIVNGSTDITSSLTTGLTGTTGYIGPGYTGSIGTSTTWLDIDGTSFFFDGRGAACYMTGTWTTVQCSGGGPGANMLNFRANASTDIGTLRVLGGDGTVTVGDNAVLDDLEVEGAQRVTVTIGGVTSLDNVTATSGTTSVAASIATVLECRGGRVTVSGTGTVATCRVKDRGTVNYNTTGTLTTLEVLSGLFSLVDNEAASLTVTTATVWEGGTIDERNGLQNVTWSNGVKTNGGLFYPDPGRSLAIT